MNEGPRQPKIKDANDKIKEGLLDKSTTHFVTAVDRWKSDYEQAEIRGYAYVDAKLNKDGTFKVSYWDRDWRNDPLEHIVINTKIKTKEELLDDIDERNSFIDRSISRYEKQKELNLILKNRLLE